MKITSAKDLEVYRKAYGLAMFVFDVSRQFPTEERYALTSQIRRSSRSICLNLREAWLRPVDENLCSMFMRSRAGRMAGFTSGNPTVWNAGWKSTMQVEFQPLGMIGLGYCFVSRSSQQEARRDGLNASSNNHEVGDFVGLKNEATPSEGAKRRYEAHFISKLTDCDGENSETDSSLDFAKDCGYITADRHAELTALCIEIGKMLGSMIKNPTPFLITGYDVAPRK